MYEIYILPSCAKCSEVTGLLKERGENFEKIDLSTSEGMKRLKRTYSQYKNQIKREVSGGIAIPIVVFINGDNRLFYQGREGLEGFLDKNADILISQGVPE
jgi:glutaredoxin